VEAGVKMNLPDWFCDREIGGQRALAILRKHNLDPDDPFGRHVLLELMAFREYAEREGVEIRRPWGLFVRFCRMAAFGEPRPLTWSAEAEFIRDNLAKRGAFGREINNGGA